MNRKQAQSELFEAIFSLACLEAQEAGRKAVCTPMVVTQHENMADDASPAEKQWYVADGVCGFAWVNVYPGNCPFANWLKATKRGEHDSYYGGVSVNGIGYRDERGNWSQSMTRNEAYCHAFAVVLNQKGINAHARSRID